MEFHPLDRYYTGVAVPVSALRTELDTGVGEFADLVELGTWAREAGLSVIQILPVNDTGNFASPYSALSAIALHPIYIRISDLPEAHTPHLDDLARLKSDLDSLTRVDYQRVLSGKLEILRNVYDAARDGGFDFSGLDAWIADNTWVRPYGVFRTLRERYGEQAWTDWEEHKNPTDSDIDRLWTELPDARFFAWIQWRLEDQLKDAAEACRNMGVALKGDLPILMEEDSCDVWYRRDIFQTELRAGAPPDFFSTLGQNWGFPAYDWDQIEKNKFSWWHARLAQADKFYQAFRIDHVLGFFRLWVIPSANSSGLIGYFEPSAPITEADLRAIGLPEHRVVWLSEPHVRGSMIREEFGDSATEILNTFFARIGNEDLFLFAPSVDGERFIEEHCADDQIRGRLLELYRDRALLKREDGVYAPAWNFNKCTRFSTLSADEQRAFADLVADKREQSENLWAEQGRRLLSGLTGEVSMLACAEDLGVIPRAVPETLSSLEILGLRVPRWAKWYGTEGEPFIHPKDYPYLTVCAPSVHDTSTIRGWFHEDRREAVAFARSIGLETDPDQDYDEHVAELFLDTVAETNSALLVFQIQDYMALDRSLISADPANERINVPGTYNDQNWTYRLPVTIGELRKRSEVRDRIARIAERRKNTTR